VTEDGLPAELAGRVDAALASLRTGGVVVLTDAVRDLGVAGLAARAASPPALTFLIKDCRGIVYAGASRDQLTRLSIGHQVGSDVMRSHVYVAVDAVDGVTTGVSASDRTATIKALVDTATTRRDLRTPGHVLPTLVDASGAIERFYLNEALQHLVTLAGMGEGVALSAVLARDGSLATVEQLAAFAARHGLPCLDLADVVRVRRWTQGWEQPWTGSRTYSLVHLRTDVAVSALGAHERHDTFPVELLPLCAAGHVVGASCSCQERLRDALSALAVRGRGAVAVTWPAGRPFAVDAVGDHTAGPVPRIARLLAAELAAAEPGANRTSEAFPSSEEATHS
jgi:3,4-dihydroxy-2-butanone 4-phosphate synthase